MAMGDAVFGPVSCPRRTTTDRWGPPVSEGEGKAGVPVRDGGDAGLWARSGLGPDGFPSAFLLFSFFFSFSFSVFLFCFIIFAKMIQINSN
jgi:hypothetical protein